MTFSSFQVADIIGATKESFQNWYYRGIIRASIPAEGAGTRSVFTTNDIYRITLLKGMVDSGVNRKLASQIAYDVVDIDKPTAEFKLGRNLSISIDLDSIKKHADDRISACGL